MSPPPLVLFWRTTGRYTSTSPCQSAASSGQVVAVWRREARRSGVRADGEPDQDRLACENLSKGCCGAGREYAASEGSPQGERETEGGATMDQVCFALPVISGKTEDARAFFKELEGSRKAEFAKSEERIGIPKESWYLQKTPMADLLIGYMESPDFGRALDLFARSQDEFDVWFKRRLAELTGADLNSPPPGPMSEQVSSYEARVPVA